MSPQPIKTIIPNPSLSFTPEIVAQERPEVAQWIAQGIMNWSWVETQTATVFISLLGTNRREGAALYSAFESDRLKDGTLRTLALSALESEERHVFNGLLKLMQQQRKARNRLAHWYWGICTELTDGAVAMHQQYILRNFADVFEWREGDREDNIKLDLDNVYAFRTATLAADAIAFAELARLLSGLNSAVMRPRGSETRVTLFQWLSQNARLAEVLARTPKAGQRTPPTPP